MSFISLEFVGLVLVTVALYYTPQLVRLQVGILLVASVCFYAWDQWRILPLLIVAVGVTYWAMRLAVDGSWLAAAGGIAANLAILAFFKYKFLLAPSFVTLETGSQALDTLLQLPLPIGISFFVFHNISLIADYYRKPADRPTPTLSGVTLYIIFFPQLVSGPITRSASFMPQIEAKRLADVPWEQIGKLLIAGLFFKLFCANNLAQATALMDDAAGAHLGGGDRLVLLFLYSAQIYADFFGYSTLALGLALLFGYRLPVNFRLPYTARSFSDFWRRWHISLSMWLKHYLYIPLGGDRISHGRTYLNLMIVMGLGGLWHGASISYAIWGLGHGVLLALERFVSQRLPDHQFGAFARVGYAAAVFVCVSLLWLLFRFQDFSAARTYFIGMVTDPATFSKPSRWYLFAAIYASPVLLQHAIGERVRGLFGPGVSGLLYGAMLWLALAEQGADTPFIYFRF